MNSAEQLRVKREVIKSQIRRYETYLGSLDARENIDKDEVNSRFKTFSKTLERFEEVQEQIEILQGGNIEERERDEVEDAFHKAVALTRQILDSFTSATVHDTLNNSATDNLPLTGQIISIADLETRLPSVDLPKFDGKYNEWITFRDMFTDMVHNNAKLTNSRKLYYLKTCVKGRAAKVIENISLAEDQYEVAWDLLSQRYENKKRIVFKHMRAIYDLPVIQRESAAQLRSLLDEFNSNFRALSILGVDTNNWHVPVVCAVVSKLDSNSKKEWERLTKKCEIEDITINKFVEFLTDKCLLLENENEDRFTKNRQVTAATQIGSQNSYKTSCYFCKEPHLNQNCDKFVKMSLEQRMTEIMKLKLCKNCLRPNHLSFECRSTSCKYCHKKHHWLLHDSKNVTTGTSNSNSDKSPETTTEIPRAESQNNNAQQTHTCTCIRTSETEIESKKVTAHSQSVNNTKNGDYSQEQVLLATANLNIFDQTGNALQCRALLDSASQISYISAELANNLGLNKFGDNISVEGSNGTMTSTTKLVRARIGSINGSYEIKETFAIVNKIINQLPQYSFDMAVLNVPDNIELADTKFNEPSEIDVLLGASVFYDVLGKKEKRLGKHMPILRETKLGWIIAGPIGYSNAKRVVCNLSITNEDLHNEVKRFWMQEEIQNKEKNNTKVEKEVESHFLATYQRLEDGRFEVKLPFKTNVTELGDSVQNATKRFESLEKRLKRDPELKVEYCKFMKEYQILGHMSEIDLELENEKTRNFYLPHHCVQKETSSTTKLRVVFDASAKSTSGLSLNDVLKTGPVIQSDLFAIITNFRKYNVVIIGDIEKMYRQVQVAANDREFQRILWRSEPGEELKHYRLNTVTYGTAPASYLACRALYQLGIENEKGFPEASKAIKFNFYMDDLMTGADNTESALKLKSEITNILQTGGFKLRKWNSNQAELLTDVVGDNKLEYEIAEGNDVRVLGLVWNPLKDCFSYSVKLNKPSIVTKRFILSTIARIFDPLGLINPIIVKSKLILQRLWREKIDWDEDVPPDIVKIWEPFYDSLIELNSIIIPRKVVGSDYDNVEIHGFSDASELAFGACVYIRTSNKGEHVTRLLCAKSKVAPLRKITLPRLELNGALLLARLVNKVKRDFDLDMHKGILWTDSTIVLSWLAAEPCTWNTYVANRVTEIQDLSKSFEWRHIPSAQNPADILSRGSYPSNLLDNNLWWNGPKFLTTENYLWPDNIAASYHELPERKTIKLCTLTTINFDYFFEIFVFYETP